MNNHPYGISQLTSARSGDLLSEGRQRQLAKTAPSRPRSGLRQPVRLVHSWASRVLALAGSIVRSPLPARSEGTAATSSVDPMAKRQSVVASETL
jgi:hypothetical protein